MTEGIIDNHKAEFEKAVEHFVHELSGVRTGRANPAFLNTVMVESYGQLMPIGHMASITVSDATTLAISPWDKGQLGAIEKAIQQANLGLNPSNDGNIIRISLPKLTEERRKEMVKLIGQMAEKARVSIRNVREATIKELKKTKEDGKISEDDLESGKEKLQKQVDGYNEEIREYAEKKEKELMTV
ncbi:MAG: ribosome recycling factor [Candidatus Doudnabacteria bacterium CG10_big_fil_rev_8_21_14_0_10_42_18]|uniref:Ribosome-recycling factor n=1 Tax=Candidatus Doudnabacteria bacterium CG10_big_fil_rev_8_21_14_0_10_42_18 TaxID=1974552 RepID=A0A2H0VC08_9BACT|nr:MAG: ribosome recycling factor [Candidatus Doudnabacteria bacterium CG10_big_fil_rev_8_21_14_0_10_42_18]